LTVVNVNVNSYSASSPKITSLLSNAFYYLQSDGRSGWNADKWLDGGGVRCRHSMAVDKSVNDLLALVKSTLTAEEMAWMSTPDTRSNEPDAYTALQNHFTQKNTDAIIKCASFHSIRQS